MDTLAYQKSILTSAEAARKAGQSVDIVWMLPTVHVHRGPDDEFFFQEYEAQKLIDDAVKATAEMEDATAADFILAMAQGW